MRADVSAGRLTGILVRRLVKAARSLSAFSLMKGWSRSEPKRIRLDAATELPLGSALS